MVVLSLFDGIACARVALEKANISVGKYYSSEIDKDAIKIAEKNHPNLIQLGDVTQIDSLLEKPDLIIGGSPCQDLSIAGKRAGLSGDRSGLFYHFVRLVKDLQPTHFILENVASMSKESKDLISDELGVDPIMIDASYFTAQIRRRYFWCNFRVPQPTKKIVVLKDILEPRDRALDITDRMMAKREGTLAYVNAWKFVRTEDQLARTLTTGGQNISNTGATNLYKDGRYWKLTPVECERLMGLPDGYTEGVSNTARYFVLGNGFNVDVVAHILKHMGNRMVNRSEQTVLWV
jgi:DNA (cytosine-5)-methyltransferase 3A